MDVGIAVSSSSNMLAKILYNGFLTYPIAACHPRHTTFVVDVSLKHGVSFSSCTYTSLFSPVA